MAEIDPMTLDPKDFLVTGASSINADSFRSYVHSSVVTARSDATVGINQAVDAGVISRSFLSPSLITASALTSAYPNSAFSSIAALREPYESLATTAVASTYAGTLNALAVAGTIGASARDLYTTGSIPAINANPTLATHLTATSLAGMSPSVFASLKPFEGLTGVVTSNAALALGLTSSPLGLAGTASLLAMNSVVSPYLASVGAVHSLETSYARLSNTSVGALASPGYITGLTALGVSALKDNVVDMSGALRSTWEGLHADSGLLGNATLGFLRTPASELYTAAHAAASISLPRKDQPDVDDEMEEILDDAVDAFESRLAALNQGLVTIYRGGVAAIERGGPDWQRHCMTSFRELSTHVLHILAPDDQILSTATSGDLHNGRPTRRARLNYIFASVTGSSIATFYEADLKAALDLFDLLNDGTHRLAGTATSEQVRYLKGRLVGLVSSMLSSCGL